MQKVEETITLETMKDFASKVLLVLEKQQGNLHAERACVLELRGDLGAGKTTFTQHLAELLGVRERVISPTFILKKTYATKHPLFKKLVHIDAYRFNHHKEAHVLKLEDDMPDVGSLIVIEWPEHLPPRTPKAALDFTVLGEHIRKATFTYEK